MLFILGFLSSVVVNSTREGIPINEGFVLCPNLCNCIFSFKLHNFHRAEEKRFCELFDRSYDKWAVAWKDTCEEFNNATTYVQNFLVSNGTYLKQIMKKYTNIEIWLPSGYLSSPHRERNIIRLVGNILGLVEFEGGKNYSSVMQSNEYDAPTRQDLERVKKLLCERSLLPTASPPKIEEENYFKRIYKNSVLFSNLDAFLVILIVLLFAVTPTLLIILYFIYKK